MLKDKSKIAVIGGSGNGKTTLTNNLGRMLNLPVYHIDGMNYLENWVPRDKEERDKMILSKIKENKWVIDGTYHATLKQRLENADFIIFLDYSSLAQIKGVLQRFRKQGGKEKPEIPGCKEKLDLKFLKFVWNWRKDKRKDIIENLKSIDKNKVVIFKNRNQLNRWYYKQFNEKMVI